ncbi:rod shape-determining protein [Photobacterium lutimaris]|uniref:Rod shape-determining protein MreB n=1 Tax=Photobacterium lutimaris TaxID=388278 RepID=A0A2T3J0H9_9GAMM|nr:rod shape-determining protein [Photobacterium lutimaris]PSU34578.1 rod shape-determining protein MreB [Photobacterium lutimaris]TDR71587.1 rod shape-determining protein MreB [Photobacterium lutimaris]
MSILIRGLFSNDLLVELSEKKIVIRTIGNGPKLEYEPYLAFETVGKKSLIKSVGSEAKLQSGKSIQVINPFSHPRSFVADFYVAEKLIQHGLREMHKEKFFKPAPRIIMHQLEKTEGGLTNIEERVLRELAAGSGAREVVIYVGEKLDSDRISFDDVKRKMAI